jgi:hypothetical protein
LSIDEVVERVIQISPGSGERAASGELGREQGVEQSEARRQDPAMGLGEQHGDTPTEWGQLVPL